jgi:hypothetical protein
MTAGGTLHFTTTQTGASTMYVAGTFDAQRARQTGIDYGSPK